MTNKEIAKQLRNMSKRIDELTQDSLTDLADELDPPKPTPGTIVWWRHDDMQNWEIGEAGKDGVWATGSNPIIPWDKIQYKPARILAPDEVAVKVQEQNNAN